MISAIDSRGTILPRAAQRGLLLPSGGLGGLATNDFGDPAAIAQINDWVSGHTRGKIPQIVDTPDDGIVAMLLDAVYFNGRWQHPFDEKKTKLRP